MCSLVIQRLDFGAEVLCLSEIGFSQDFTSDRSVSQDMRDNKREAKVSI